MKIPVLDDRSAEDVRTAAARLAKSYTPEWRLDGTGDDPGAAILDLFATMFHQTIQRWNAVPEKLYLDFLNQIGYQEPGAAPSQGVLRFTPAETVDNPVGVPMGTQVFTPDAAGENVVFETLRPIQATAARLTDIYYTSADQDEIRRLDRSRPQRFFTPEGEAVQRHLLALGQNDALRLDCPSVISLRPRREARYLEEEAVRRLTEPGLRWYFLHNGEEIPFDEARGEKNEVILEKRNHLSIDAVALGADGTPPEGFGVGPGAGGPADGAGFGGTMPAPNGAGGAQGAEMRCIYCRGRPAEDLTLEGVTIASIPAEECPAQTLFSGDIPMDREAGDYCFSRRPALFSLFYLRCDTALSKRTAMVHLRLDLSFVVDDPAIPEPQIAYGQAIIDRQSAVTTTPDDVFVSGVVWEYYNGLGWKNLEIKGNRNPFAAREAGQGEVSVTFQIPPDLREIEVNAEPGLYIRVRVTDVENQYSLLQRWIVPYVKEAAFTWQYRESASTPLPRADWAWAENNGIRRAIPNAAPVAQWHLPAFRVMEPGEEAMYFRFDRSPHAMPLSIRFWMEGRTRMEAETQWEARTVSGYVPLQCLDQTENLLHSGEMSLFLPEALAEAEQFGQRGYWLRLRRASLRPGAPPVVREVELNTVGAVQVQRQPIQIFDTEEYEAGKTIEVPHTPVWNCRVWVDELSALTPEEARQMAKESRGRVALEEDGHTVARCWVLWNRTRELALSGPEERSYALDPWTGAIRFGDGVHGRVPPRGGGNIRVEYGTTRGNAGNVPAGTVNAPLGGLPRISSLTNVTAMSGGTGRLELGAAEAAGSRCLRHRGRACGRQDYEDLVAELFPQVRHVRCFPGRDQNGGNAPGHVTVAVAGYGERSEDMEALCQAVYGELSRRVSCTLTAEGRLHVCPAVELKVNIQVTVELSQPEYAAETQQDIVRRLNQLIDGTWRSRPIGEQIRLSEIWTTVRETENVSLIRQIMPEAAWDDAGRPRLSPLDYQNDFPYAVVRNGTHTVKLI